MSTTMLTWSNLLIILAISVGVTIAVFVLLVVRDRSSF